FAKLKTLGTSRRTRVVRNLLLWRDVPMSHAKQLHNRRYLNDYLEIINREGLPGNVKNDLCRKVQDTVIATRQHVIEAALDEELRASLGLDRYEHVPWGLPPESNRRGRHPPPSP